MAAELVAVGLLSSAIEYLCVTSSPAIRRMLAFVDAGSMRAEVQCSDLSLIRVCL